MYTHNEIGPWPIVDPSAAQIIRTSGAVDTAIGSPLNVCLDTANLGSKSEAFINGAYTATHATTGAQRLSFGVCLKPLQDIMNQDNPIFVDISMGIDHYESSTIVTCTPFIGFIDTAGASITNGWNATHNLVTNFIPIPQGGSDPSTFINKQILLKDITSGGLDLDKFLCVGFSLRSQSSQSFDDISYYISARYATKSINTVGRGV